MEHNALTLVPERKANKGRRRLGKIILLLIFLLIICAGVYGVVVEFSITNIEISGLTTYSESEVIHAVQVQDYVPNTLIMILENKLFGQTYLPFVEKVTMDYKQPHTLRIHIKEKLRAGVFEYMDKYVYFNDDGMAMESRNALFEGVPVVTGLEFDKLVLGEKIPVNGDYFQTIVLITKKISTYELDISEIHFEGEDDITLTSGDYKIYLGSKLYLEEKMSKISPVLDSLKKEKKNGMIDMHLYTDEKEIITFRKEQKN